MFFKCTLLPQLPRNLVQIKYFLRTEVALMHAHCKLELWELRESEINISCFRKIRYEYTNALLPQLPPDLDQIFYAQ